MRFSIVKLPAGSTKAFRAVAVEAKEPLEPHKVAWLVDRGEDEDVLVSMTIPTEAQALLARCLAEPISEELKQKIHKCLNIVGETP